MTTFVRVDLVRSPEDRRTESHGGAIKVRWSLLGDGRELGRPCSKPGSAGESSLFHGAGYEQKLARMKVDAAQNRRSALEEFDRPLRARS